MGLGVSKGIFGGVSSIFKGRADKNNFYSLDGRVPFGQAIFFGLQHILAMFIANVAPLLIVFGHIGLTGEANLALMDQGMRDIAQNSIQNAIFIAGIATILQIFFGARLPVVMGASFAYVGLFLSFYHGQPGVYGPESFKAYYTILGSIIVGAAFIVLIGPFVKYWKKLIKPIVPPIVVLGIGLSLMSVGASYFLGSDSSFTQTGLVKGFEWQILVAVITLAVSLIWQLIFKRSLWSNINIIVSMIVGYIVAYLLTYFGVADIIKADWDTIFSIRSVTDIINVPQIVDFKSLIFEPVPIIMTCIVFFIAAVEGIGDCSAIAGGSLGREATSREMGGTITVGALSGLLGALFGSFPLATFSQNVGIVTEKKMNNRFIVFVGAIFLVICGFLPPLANILLTIPYCVLGGAIIVVFGSIAVTGMRMVFSLGHSEKNNIILALSLCLGFGLTLVTDFLHGLSSSESEILRNVATIISNPVLNMFVISLLLAWILPENMALGKAKGESRKKKKEKTSKKSITEVFGDFDPIEPKVSASKPLTSSKPKPSSVRSKPTRGPSIDLGSFGKVESSSSTKEDMTSHKR